MYKKRCGSSSSDTKPRRGSGSRESSRGRRPSSSSDQLENPRTPSFDSPDTPLPGSQLLFTDTEVATYEARRNVDPSQLVQVQLRESEAEVLEEDNGNDSDDDATQMGSGQDLSLLDQPPHEEESQQEETEEQARIQLQRNKEFKRRLEMQLLQEDRCRKEVLRRQEQETQHVPTTVDVGTQSSSSEEGGGDQQSEDEEVEDDRRRQVALTRRKEMLLVERLHHYPLLYDKGHKEFKNRPKKVRVWNQLAEEVKVSGDTLQRWFTSKRTQYGKLRRGKKSGSGRTTYTDNERFILDNFKFLDPFILRARPTKVLGADEVNIK